MRSRRILFIAIMALVLPGAVAFAQSSGGRGAPAQSSLTVTSNVAGAVVLLNHQQMGTTPYSRTLNPGTYLVTVQAPGYQDFDTTVSVNGPTHVNAFLQSNNYSLSITSNVNGANVFLNGSQVGQTPYTASLSPGTYQLRVSSGGYQEFNTQVTVNQDTSINAQLQPINYSLHITANVGGAEVFLNGQRVGRAPYTATLPPGNYELRLMANGYQVFRTQIVVDQNRSFHARLEPQLALVHIRIPDQFLNVHSEHGRGDRRRAVNDIHVFVDNRPENGDNFRVPEGNHTIRFESGSFVVQHSFHFNGGQEYTISPELSIRVHQ